MYVANCRRVFVIYHVRSIERIAFSTRTNTHDLETDVQNANDYSMLNVYRAYWLVGLILLVDLIMFKCMNP